MIKSPILAQANALTQGRYDFSAVEKRAVYFIIQAVRKQFVERPDGQRNIFDNLVIQLSTEHLQKSDTTLQKLYEGMKSLRKKSITIDNEEMHLEVGYINYFKHKKGASVVEVEVSKMILPYLVELSKGFTSYHLTVAISLKTKYSQRFYEYSSQYRETGFFTFTLEELREKLALGDKYPRYALVKSYIIEPAFKELKAMYEDGQCDLYFTYKEEKVGRTVERINFFVKTTKGEEKETLKPDDYIYFIRTWLSSWLKVDKRPRNKVWIGEVVSHLQRTPERLPECYEKLVWIQKNKPAVDWAPYARFVIDEEFLTD
jgi:plasmid replication initiation protein